MLEQKRRIIVLAFVMVCLVGAISMFSTWLLYQTSLEEQKHRLHELVQSQASIVLELGHLGLQLRVTGRGGANLDIILAHLVRAHRRFQIQSKSGEFTVAKGDGSNIEFLIVNGERVPSFSPLFEIPLESPNAVPMKNALMGKSGTMLGLDYRGKEVMAAYTPLFLQDDVLGLVAKIDLDEIKAPFFRANFMIFGVGLLLTLVGLAFFFKLSEPIIQGIQNSEKNYRDLVEGARNLIIRINSKGIISFANNYARTTLKTQTTELVGHNALCLLGNQCNNTDSDDSLTEIVNFFGEGEGPHEIAISLENGTTEWISWTVREIKDDMDVVKELLCIGNSVTAKHLAHEAQRDLEERFQGIAKASPVGIIITDMEGNLTYANERMHSLSGVGPVEMIGRAWLTKIHQDDKHLILSNWYKTHPIVNDRIEFRLKHLSEKVLWILGQIVDLRNSNGDVVGNIITMTDITQVKEAESEHKRLTTAMNQAAELIVITDLAGNIIYVNPAFEHVTGYSRKEVLGKNPRILNSGEQNKEFYEDLWKTITSGRVWKGQLINVRKNGQRYTQEATISPVRNEKDETVNYVAVARDITNQLTVEAQLRQAQKLESIGELAAGIAHEINTPTQYVTTNTHFLEESFTTLMGMLERSNQLAKSILSGLPQDELVALANEAIDEAEFKYLAEDIPQAIAESGAGLKRIAEIVQSVKQLAHPGEINKSYHNLNDIVTNAVTVSSNEWKYVAEIELKLDENLPGIYCLRGEIGQVVLNLIINGAHAIQSKTGTNSEQKGIITIQTAQEEDWGVLSITDTGTGMSQEVVNRAFDPFFTTKEVGKGTGQGLAITHNVIVNMHGGTISVETEEGIGSTFIIRLPLKED